MLLSPAQAQGISTPTFDIQSVTMPSPLTPGEAGKEFRVAWTYSTSDPVSGAALAAGQIKIHVQWTVLCQPDMIPTGDLEQTFVLPLGAATGPASYIGESKFQIYAAENLTGQDYGMCQIRGQARGDQYTLAPPTPISEQVLRFDLVEPAEEAAPEPASASHDSPAVGLLVGVLIVALAALVRRDP